MNDTSLVRNQQTFQEKQDIQFGILKLFVEELEITDHKEISNLIKDFAKHFFRQNVSKNNAKNKYCLITSPSKR